MFHPPHAHKPLQQSLTGAASTQVSYQQAVAPMHSSTPASGNFVAQQMAAPYPSVHYTMLSIVINDYTTVMQQSLQSLRCISGQVKKKKKPLVLALTWPFSVVASPSQGKTTSPLPVEHEPCGFCPSRIGLYQQLHTFTKSELLSSSIVISKSVKHRVTFTLRRNAWQEECTIRRISEA